ncbi:MAG: hypothetical protein KDD73_10520 [Anaerolineales bacterium]|nr:hypothetical protein [Anaerolineales bacterium]MCB9128214.1 hypothetical protein [Ardenticatenales bacterium]
MLSFTLLGDAKIFKDGTPLHPQRSHKETALLFYLAHTGQAWGREFLADLLWESRSTQQSLKNLRTTLSRTRKSIGDALLVSRDAVAIAADAHQ